MAILQPFEVRQDYVTMLLLYVIQVDYLLSLLSNEGMKDSDSTRYSSSNIYKKNEHSPPHETSVSLISKLDKDGTRKKTIGQFHSEYRCKNPKQNINKPNPKNVLKDNSIWLPRIVFMGLFSSSLLPSLLSFVPSEADLYALLQ